jgi:hypothetical protein
MVLRLPFASVSVSNPSREVALEAHVTGLPVRRKGTLCIQYYPCARTSLSPKHRGITYFLQTPGIAVRPLRQITGRAQFDVVYLADDVVPENAV